MLQQFGLPNGTIVLDQLYGFPLIKNSHVLATKRSAATGFDCGAPPEPSVCMNSEILSCSIFHIIID